MISTKTAEDTEAVGARLGCQLAPGDLILLEGELGAGKTTFARGVARGAGYKGRVSSPTFALAHVYKGRRLIVHHLDMYRLAGGDPTEVGLEDLLRDPKAAVIVEWPGAVASGWPKERLEVKLAHSMSGRTLRFKARGARAKALAGKLA